MATIDPGQGLQHTHGTGQPAPQRSVSQDVSQAISSGKVSLPSTEQAFIDVAYPNLKLLAESGESIDTLVDNYGKSLSDAGKAALRAKLSAKAPTLAGEKAAPPKSSAPALDSGKGSLRPHEKEHVEMLAQLGSSDIAKGDYTFEGFINEHKDSLSENGVALLREKLASFEKKPVPSTAPTSSLSSAITQSDLGQVRGNKDVARQIVSGLPEGAKVDDVDIEQYGEPALHFEGSMLTMSKQYRVKVTDDQGNVHSFSVTTDQELSASKVLHKLKFPDAPPAGNPLKSFFKVIGGAFSSAGSAISEAVSKSGAAITNCAKAIGSAVSSIFTSKPFSVEDDRQRFAFATETPVALLDVDGTLFGKSGEPNIALVSALKEQGIKKCILLTSFTGSNFAENIEQGTSRAAAIKLLQENDIEVMASVISASPAMEQDKPLGTYYEKQYRKDEETASNIYGTDKYNEISSAAKNHAQQTEAVVTEAYQNDHPGQAGEKEDMLRHVLHRLPDGAKVFVCDDKDAVVTTTKSVAQDQDIQARNIRLNAIHVTMPKYPLNTMRKSAYETLEKKVNGALPLKTGETLEGLKDKLESAKKQLATDFEQYKEDQGPIKTVFISQLRQFMESK